MSNDKDVTFYASINGEPDAHGASMSPEALADLRRRFGEGYYQVHEVSPSLMLSLPQDEPHPSGLPSAVLEGWEFDGVSEIRKRRPREAVAFGLEFTPLESGPDVWHGAGWPEEES